MNFVHSIWTRPLIANKRGSDDFVKTLITNTYSYAVSAAYIKHNGGKIVLYADGLGQDMLSFIPYDEIYKLTMPDNIPSITWAAGKFYALEHMNLGDVHIDGDVYIKKENLLNIICEQKDYDMVVQSVEDDKTTLKKYYTTARNILMNNNIKPLTCHLEESPSYNCGTIGFFNQTLKTKYINEYYYILHQIIKNKKCLTELKYEKQAIPDLIMEQQFIYELSQDYKVNNILGNIDTVYERAIELGYQHVLGSFKQQLLSHIINELEYLDEDLYKKANKHLKYLT